MPNLGSFYLGFICVANFRFCGRDVFLASPPLPHVLLINDENLYQRTIPLPMTFSTATLRLSSIYNVIHPMSYTQRRNSAGEFGEGIRHTRVLHFELVTLECLAKH